MKKFDVIGVHNLNWSKIISLSYKFDSYHTRSYSLLEQDKNSEPLLCVAYFDNDFIAIPLIIRKIESTNFFDCTSVYGYCGPVSNLPSESLSIDHIKFFQKKLMEFFIERNIVSAFSRLHPLLDQSVFFTDFGSVKDINQTVSIDLRLSEDDQLKQYRKSCKSEINQIKRKGFTVSEASTKSEIELFIQLYYDLMKRVNADSYYFFKKEYFYQLLNNPCFKTKLLLARINNDMAAGALFTFANTFMQYHLAVSKEEYRKDAPMKLILDQARLIGMKNNMDFLHLGGGVNGNINDSLFQFKSGFSDIKLVFRVWQMVVDKEKYSYLIDFFNVENRQVTNYFPIYRAKIFSK